MIQNNSKWLPSKCQKDSFGVDERLRREYLRVEWGNRYSDLPKQPVAGIERGPVTISKLTGDWA